VRRMRDERTSPWMPLVAMSGAREIWTHRPATTSRTDLCDNVEREGGDRWALEIRDATNRMSLSHTAAHFCALAACAASRTPLTSPTI